MDEHLVREVQSVAIFPLPFRVLFLLSSGILAWATNLHGLHLHAIDGPSVLQLDPSALPTTRSPASNHVDRSSSSYRPIYRLFFHCAAWCLSIWLVYWYLTLHHVEYVDVFKYLPAVGALGLVIGLVCPYDVLELREREKFLSCVVFLSQPFTSSRITCCAQCYLPVHQAPKIRSVIFRRSSRGYLHILCQSFWRPLAFLVDVAAGGQSARVAISGWLVPLGFADLDEVCFLHSCFPPVLISRSSEQCPVSHSFQTVPCGIQGITQPKPAASLQRGQIRHILPRHLPLRSSAYCCIRPYGRERRPGPQRTVAR